MPRVTVQKKSARGKDVKCGRCGAPIKVGEDYKKWAKRSGFGRFSSIKFYRCMKGACAPKGSELLSGRAAEAAAINENLDDAIQVFRDTKDLPAFLSALDDVISEAESLRDEMQDGFDNMPEGLQQGDTGQLIEERVQACDSFIDELTSAKDQFDESELDEESFADDLDAEFSDEDDDSDEDAEDADAEDGDADQPEQTREDRLAEMQRDKAEDIASEFDGISLEI